MALRQDLTGDQVKTIYDFAHAKFGRSDAGTLQMMATMLDQGQAGQWTLEEMAKTASNALTEGE